MSRVYYDLPLFRDNDLTLLLIDDRPDEIEAFRVILEMYGVKTLRLETANAALKFLEQEKRRPPEERVKVHGVILDILFDPRDSIRDLTGFDDLDGSRTGVGLFLELHRCLAISENAGCLLPVMILTFSAEDIGRIVEENLSPLRASGKLPKNYYFEVWRKDSLGVPEFARKAHAFLQAHYLAFGKVGGAP